MKLPLNDKFREYRREVWDYIVEALSASAILDINIIFVIHQIPPTRFTIEAIEDAPSDIR